MPYMTQHEKDELAIVAEKYREARHKESEIRAEWDSAHQRADALYGQLEAAQEEVETLGRKLRNLADGT